MRGVREQGRKEEEVTVGEKRRRESRKKGVKNGKGTEKQG